MVDYGTNIILFSFFRKGICLNFRNKNNEALFTHISNFNLHEEF